jgi:hypothetical protein
MSRSTLNNADPNTLADQLREAALGNLLLGQMVQSKRKVNPSVLGVGSYTLGTLHALQLPDYSRASVIQRATMRAAGITAGELTVVAYGTTPTSGQISVAPNGDIVTLAADAITDLDVTYVPERGDVIDAVFPVVSNVLTLPTNRAFARGAVLLLEAEALVGTVTGKKIVLVPAASAPATGQAKLNLAKTTVTFATADAVTRARVKVLVGQLADLHTVLNEVDDFV